LSSAGGFWHAWRFSPNVLLQYATTASILIPLDQGVRSRCLWNCRSCNNFVAKCGLAKYWGEINIDNGWSYPLFFSSDPVCCSTVCPPQWAWV
jgi:hypothetical protein